MTTSPILGIPYIASQQSQPDVTHNEGISLLQIILAGGAIQIGLDTPPASPTEGDVYVIGTSPTGVWAGRPNSIAGFFLGQWLFVPGDDSNGTPIVMGSDQEGLTIWSKVDNAHFTWTDLGASPDAFTWRPSPSNVTQLSLLDDTNITSPAENDIFLFIDGFWENRNTNVLYVDSPDRLPAAVAGVRTIGGSTTIQCNGLINIGTDRIVTGVNTAIFGLNRALDGIISTGTGDLFTTTTENFLMYELAIVHASGAVWNYTGDGLSGSSFILNNIVVVACDTLGTITDPFIMTIRPMAVLAATTGGLLFSGTNGKEFTIGNSTTTNTGGTLLDFGSATFDVIDIAPNNRFEIPYGSVAVSGLVDSGNIRAGGFGLISASIFTGEGTFLENISQDDILWDISGNGNLESTMPRGLLSLSGNTTTTTVSGGTPALVAGTWTVEAASHFTGTAAGRLTYDGVRPILVDIDVAITLEPASGTNKDLEVYIALNGTVITKTKMIRRTDSGNPGVVPTGWQQEINQGDFFEVFVANASDDVAVLGSDIVFKIR